jgi:hypothetical protein
MLGYTEMSWRTKQPNWDINSITALIMLLSILMPSAASTTSHRLSGKETGYKTLMRLVKEDDFCWSVKACSLRLGYMQDLAKHL